MRYLFDGKVTDRADSYKEMGEFAMVGNYVLLTPAYNEEKLLWQLIDTVTKQTVLPKKWVIIDDGSSDATPEIAKRAAAKHGFINYLRLRRDDIVTYYSRRVHVNLAGYEHVRHFDFEYVAFLDADITMPSTFYENLLHEFEKDASLGVASGTFVICVDGREHYLRRDINSAAGSTQMFRRDCYDAIGGYVPLRYGGDDTLANTMARMRGWQTRAFDEYRVIQHRNVGARDVPLLKARYQQGVMDYHLGYHPLFMLAKVARRAMEEKPAVLGGVMRGVGYFGELFRFRANDIPAEVKHYLRREQILRLRNSIRHLG